MKMKRTYYKLLMMILFVVPAVGCDVEQVEPGAAPEVEVDVDPGSLPEYDVETPDVDVSTEETEITVPTGVDVETDETTVTTPDIDVTLPDESEKENEEEK